MALDFDFKAVGEPFEVLWPVTVNEPINGGKVQERKFTARFRIIDPDDAQQLLSEEKGMAFVKAVFVGLDEKHGELTPELLAHMMSRPWVRSAVVTAYFSCASGAAVKN